MIIVLAICLTRLPAVIPRRKERITEGEFAVIARVVTGGGRIYFFPVRLVSA